MENLRPHEIQSALHHYFRKLLIPNGNSKFKYLTFCVELIHLIFAIMMYTFALFLPHKLLPYYIILVIIVGILWKIFDGCFLTIMFQKLNSVHPQVRGPLPLSKYFLEKITIIYLCVAILFYKYPEFSFFRLLKKIIDLLAKHFD